MEEEVEGEEFKLFLFDFCFWFFEFLRVLV